MNFIEKITLPENLYWAWNKTRQMYIRGDAWYDPIELARFEANLDLELHAISAQFKKLKYSNSPIKPLLHPKKDDADKKPQARQAFAIATRDQVAWIAFSNIIGPFIDYQMPTWSYGHRLYRAAWYETEGQKDVLKIGRYRHSTGNFYRTFHQSWNRYRRHIYLTIRAMAHVKDKAQLDDIDQRILDEEAYLAEDLKQPYLSEKYWQEKFTSPPEKIYWASIDFKLFYPSIKVSCILDNLLEYSSININEIKSLAKSLLQFPLDTNGFTEKELEAIKIDPRHSIFTGIPTGLFVAGFLANVAMLRIDNTVKKELVKKPIAHFRFVDDHVLLTPNYEDLLGWINKYKEIIEREDNGAKIKFDKTAPPELGKLLQEMFPEADSRAKASINDKNDLEEKARNATELDPKFPSPLMTKTLTLVSDIARSDNEFDLLDSREQDHLITDIVHLLLTEFPDEELRAETRVAFAATRLSRLIPRRIVDNTRISDLLRGISEQNRRKKELEKKINGLCKKRSKQTIGVCQTCQVDGNKIPICIDIDAIITEIKAKDAEIKELESEARRKEVNERNHNFSLLMKALHEYPQKLRLWTRVLQYCQQVGHDNLNELVEELTNLSRKEHYKTTAYIRAYVWNNLADQLIKCALVVVDEEILLHRRRASLMYLKAVVSLSIADQSGEDAKYYEKKSQRFFQFALGIAISIISTGKLKDEFVNQKDIIWLKAQVKKHDAFDLAVMPERWAAITDYSLSDWIWWAENRTTKMDSNTPSIVWNMIADKLDPENSTTWSLWAKYPLQLPSIAQKQLVLKNAGFARRMLSRQNEGWLYDVLKISDEKTLVQLSKNNNPFIKRVFKARQKKGHYISLDDWTTWTFKQYENDPSDPRVSEWTALTIIYHISSLLTRFEPRQQQKERLLAIHPANINIPKDWPDIQNAGLTWESWRKEIDSVGRIKINKQYLIRDSRLVPMWNNDVQTDIQFGPVRGLGMLLLGLLRRSFSWPANWNPSGHQRAWTGLAGNQIKNVSCSSWTSAILEACLQDRPRESFLINGLFSDKEYGPDDDTTLEPPVILTVSQLIDCVQKARDILRGYQLSVSNHMPRQLVPIRLEQLTRTNWDASVEGAD